MSLELPLTTTLAADPCAALVPADAQRHAAQMAQDAFAQAFRISAGEGGDAPAEALATTRKALNNWALAGGSDEASALRLALIVTGLDQWGLAYAQAFGLESIPMLSHLISTLRTNLEPRQEALFQQHVETLAQDEHAAIDFKVDLRRALHLALWHAMVASESREGALEIATVLGSLLVALTRTMPQLGWRLVADALAHIQIRCLSEPLAAEGIAQESTQTLFNSLAQALPKAEMDQIMAYSTQAVLGWQQARRNLH